MQDFNSLSMVLSNSTLILILFKVFRGNKSEETLLCNSTLSGIKELNRQNGDVAKCLRQWFATPYSLVKIQTSPPFKKGRVKSALLFCSRNLHNYCIYEC